MDWQALVTKAANSIGATVFDVRSPDALLDNADLAINARKNASSVKHLIESAWSEVESREVFVALPITTEYGAMVALHELGHVATTPWGSYTVEDEARATNWALDRMPHVSPETARGTFEALQSYIEDPLLAPTAGRQVAHVFSRLAKYRS